MSNFLIDASLKDTEISKRLINQMCDKQNCLFICTSEKRAWQLFKETWNLVTDGYGDINPKEISAHCDKKIYFNNSRVIQGSITFMGWNEISEKNRGSVLKFDIIEIHDDILQLRSVGSI